MKDKIFCDDEIKVAGFLDEQENLKSFAFNKNVALVFDDMVSRSVPSYQKVQEFTVDFGLQCVKPDSKVVDIGTSTGTTLIRLAHAFLNRSPKEAQMPNFIGVDSSEDMLVRCQEKLSALSLNKIIHLEHGNIENYDFSATSLAISHYTLQFLDPTLRLSVLSNICSGLAEGGHLILSEKIKFSDENLHTYMTKKYYQFKKSNGYSEIEIARKREALENVLRPLTIEENFNLLKEAGFKSVEIVIADLLFVTFVAVK